MMKQFELAIAAIGAGGLWFCLNKAIELNTFSLWWIAVIIFALLTIICIGDAIRRIFSDRTERILSEIGELRGIGAKFLVDGTNNVKDDSQIKIWWQSVVIWISDVKMKMSKIHKADAMNWETLGAFPPRTFLGVNNPDLNHKLTMLATRLDWLKDYIDKRTRA